MFTITIKLITSEIIRAHLTYKVSLIYFMFILKLLYTVNYN